MKKSLLLLTIVCVSACASSETPIAQFNSTTGRTIFQSAKVLVGNVSMSSGLAGGQRVMMQAFAACDGRGCTPTDVEIAFFNDSSADLNLDYRRVEVTFEGRTLNWEDEGRLTESPRYIVPRGEFIRLPLSRGDFERLAYAAEMTVSFGLTGTSTLRMPHSRREALRQMAVSMAPAAN